MDVFSGGEGERRRAGLDRAGAVAGLAPGRDPKCCTLERGIAYPKNRSYIRASELRKAEKNDFSPHFSRNREIVTLAPKLA